MSATGVPVVASDGATDDLLFDTPLARLAIGSAGAMDRLITRTQGQVALGVTIGRLVGHRAGLPVPPPSFTALDEPRIHPVRTMARGTNVTPLRPSDRLSATTGSDDLPVVLDQGNAPAHDTLGDDAAAADPGSDADLESAVSVETLAIPSYDELAASQVVKRLDGLKAGELQAIGDYERGHRGRRTILARVRQLSSEA